MKRPELLAKDLKTAAKEILGACVSMGVTAEGKDPREVQREIEQGKHDEIFSKN
jgi:large subunit ribosomal protein L11